MRISFALLLLVTLAACGADGAPTAPTETGVTLSGEGRIGVTS